MALRPQHVEIASMLIKFDTCVNAVDKWGFTALHEAAQKGRTQLCALLVSVCVCLFVWFFVGWCDCLCGCFYCCLCGCLLVVSSCVFTCSHLHSWLTGQVQC